MKPKCFGSSFLLAFVVTVQIFGAPAGVTLIARGSIPGTALDKSGLTGNVCRLGSDTSVPDNCVPQAILGGFGSALAYTGHDNVFIATPDRGPFDGLTNIPYLDRVNFLYMVANPATSSIEIKLLDTRLLKNEYGDPFVGAASAFDVNNPLRSLRLDPEGVRVSAEGTFFISDEYGPYVLEFDRQGHLIRRVIVPAKYLIAHPSSDPTTELLSNAAGRQANRGMEGLAITPDGKKLVGIMQNALLQDNALNPGTTDRISVNTRILTVDIATGQTHEYVYVLEASNRGQGVSEILAINDHEFLVLERDNRSFLQTPPQEPTRKKIFRIDLTGATDISQTTGLPSGSLPAGVLPVKKSLFIDLLDPAYGLKPAIPEKLEGLAWGPDLADGRHVLFVMSDNDLTRSLATQVFAFAIDGTAVNVNFQPQFLPGPLFPPGQVKQALKQ